MFATHHHETLPDRVSEVLGSIDTGQRNRKLRHRAEIDKISSHGETLPVSVLPRVLPRDYARTVSEVCRLLTRLHLDTLYDPKVNRDLNGSKLATILQEDGALENLPDVLIGTGRYDLAVVGEPSANNPPGVIEFNLLDCGGVGWVPTVNDLYLQVVPELTGLVQEDQFFSSTSKYFRRLGNKFLMVTDDDLDFEDYALFRRDMAIRDVYFKHITVEDFAKGVLDGTIGLSVDGVTQSTNSYNALYLKGLSMDDEVEANREVVRRIIQSRVPMYEHPSLLLMENKGIIGMLPEGRDLSDEERALAGKVIPENVRLTRELIEKLMEHPEHSVLKKDTGHMGSSVYVGESMIPVLKDIKDPSGWCVQRKYKLNTTEVYPTNGEIGNGIVDLGAYVSFCYDSRMPERDRLLSCGVSGLLTRASQRSHVVNIKQGGCFVPVYFSA